MNGYIYAIGTMLLWGVWGILANYSLNYMDKTSVVLVTYVVASAIVLSIDPQSVLEVDLNWGIVFGVGAGVAMSLGTIFFYRALSLGSLSIIPAITALYFVVTTVYGTIVLDESVSFIQIIGVILACVAIGLMTR